MKFFVFATPIFTIRYHTTTSHFEFVLYLIIFRKSDENEIKNQKISKCFAWFSKRGVMASDQVNVDPQKNTRILSEIFGDQH